jgi:hypothetical protein
MLTVMRRHDAKPEPKPEVNTTNTRAWREAVRAELNRRGRGSQAELARALRVNSGQIADVLRETGEPDEHRHTKYRPLIDAYLASTGQADVAPSEDPIPTSKDTSELTYLLEGLAEIDRDLLREIRGLSRDEQIAAAKVLRRLRGA